MAAESFGESDGRWGRAQSPMRKILALGLNEDEVIQLMKRIPRMAKRRVRRESDPGTEADKSERLRLGQWAIRTMLALGFNESEIADMIDVHHSAISRALNPDRVMSPDNVLRLLEAVQSAGTERLKKLLMNVRVQLLDTSCDAGHSLDAGTRANIEGIAHLELLNALVLGSAPVPLTKGIYAYLASVGDPIHGLYLIKVPPESDDPKAQAVHLAMLEHELEHLRDRVRTMRKQAEKARRNPDPPNDGSIA